MAGVTGFQTQPWATMPMPQGWEAKYEPSLRRYFFINHSTKQTQWVDPRQALYQAQHQRSPQPPRAPQAPPQPPPQPQHIPMQPIAKPKCKTCKRNEVDSAGQHCGACKLEQQQREIELMRAREQMEEEKRRREQEAKLEKERERRRVQSARRRQPMPLEVLETEFGEEEVEVDKDAVKAEMRKIFPRTDRDVLDMILETCIYDKDKTIDALISMGEKRVAIKSPKRTTPTPPAAPSTSAAAAVPTLSKPNKDRIKAKLMKDYPQAGDLMVSMALDTTHYIEDRARMVLDLLKEEESSKPQSTAGSTAVTFPETTPTSTVTSTTASTAATTTTQESDSSSKTSEVTFPSTRPPTSSTLTSGGASRGGSAASTASLSAVKVSVTPSSAKSAQQAKVTGSHHKVTVGSPAKRAAKAPMSATKVAAKKATKKSAGPAKHASDFMMKPAMSLSSVHKTEAKGPDSSLATGPNLDNLKDDYEPAFGANRELAQGPDKGNKVGPAGSMGMDRSLASGPDPANRAGPEAGLVKGSMFQSLRQC